MEVYKPRYVIVALLLSAFSIMDTAQQTSEEFDAARQMIYHNQINYKVFCSERPQGEDKIACRIKDIPSVGFLVCKSPMINGVPCIDVIKTEVGNIMTLKKAKVNTVNVPDRNAIINDVQCGIDPSEDCSGFLEGWIDKKEGKFQHIRDHICEGKVCDMIKEVKTFTKAKGLPRTAADLMKIMNFMESASGHSQFKQICDLQGFFLIEGGFRVGDAAEIVETGKNGMCYAEEPTADEVIFALGKMIDAFTLKKKVCPFTEYKTCLKQSSL